MQFPLIKDADVSGKRVLLRVDYNVPLDEKGNVTNDKRIRESAPTIKYLLDKKAKVIVMTSVGRPDGKIVEKLRTAGIAKALSKLIDRDVKSAKDCIGSVAENAVKSMKPGDVVMLENLRFYAEEEKNDAAFAKKLAALGEVYVNDAFANSHREHASMHAIMQHLPAYSGFLLEKEITLLSAVLENPKKPFVAVLGGAKLETKLPMINKFLQNADKIILGGAMIFNFYKAQGLEIGKSLYDPKQVDVAKQLLGKSKGKIMLPIDVVVSKEVKEGTIAKTVDVNSIPVDMIGVDIGPQTMRLFDAQLSKAKTILWNGPMGVFEIKEFAKGTEAVAKSVAKSKAISVVGGGDSAAAVEQLGLADKFTLVSTGGGASLEFLESGTLPAIKAMQENAKKFNSKAK